MLLAKGADYNIRNKQNKNVLEYSEKSVEEVKKLIEQVEESRKESHAERAPVHSKSEKMEKGDQSVLKEKQNNEELSRPILVVNSS